MALIPGTLPSDTCYGTPQDLLELFAQYLDIPAVALQSKVFFDSVAPSDTESIWIDDTTALNPIMKLYVGGTWVEYPLVGTALTANQLVDGKATVTTPASGDYVLISQSGILKKITYGNFVPAATPTNKGFFFTKSATQTVTAATETKCTFDTTVFNQGSIITLASNTFTPTVAGYYFIQGQIYAPNGGSGYTTKVALYKNGSSLLLGVYSSSGANTGVPSVTMASGVVYFNGTTDTFELYGKTDYTIWAPGGNSTYSTVYVGDNPTYGTYISGFYLGA
jgi:hypothetical protein